MRTIAIGDVHGCAREFEAIIAMVAPGSEDRVVIVGDMIDKGAESGRVIDIAREIGAVSVRGNHEDKAIRWHRGNPVKASPARIAEWASFTPEQWAFVESSSWSMMVGSTMIVHAGIVPNTRKVRPDMMARVRNVTPEGNFTSGDGVPWFTMYQGEHDMIVGHEVRSMTEPHVHHCVSGARVYSIDTGCVYGGRMTAMVVETGEIFQVQAREVYCTRREDRDD